MLKNSFSTKFKYSHAWSEQNRSLAGFTRFWSFTADHIGRKWV